MTDVIFHDFLACIHKSLLGSTRSVKIAVAWINFKIFYHIFDNLLRRGVNLQIIINDDFINAKNDDIIDNLIKAGAVINKRKMPTSKQYMHEKFCIIDDSYVLNGSYNWSLNANKNFENLMIVDEKIVVDKFINEFNTIINMNSEYIKQLYKCSSYNVMVLEEEDNMCIGTIYNIIDGELIEKEQKYYELSLLYNLNGIYEQYDYLIDQLYDDPIELEKINAMIDLRVQQYLSSMRVSIGLPIHGIGKIGRVMHYGDIEDVFINIIWKERFCVLESRYDLN